MVDIKNDKKNVEMPLEPNYHHRKKWIKLLAVVLIVAAAAWIFQSFTSFPATSGSVWQAVFLDNNQVYFGHLSNYDKGYVVLKNIFYLRAAESLQQNSSPQGPALNLVKLGGELHGPQDEMYIPKGKIMFWENLKSDSQVSQAITSFLIQQKK